MIKEALKALLPDRYKALMDAFDQVLPHYEKLDDGHYIGVHTDALDNLQPEEKDGYFSYGMIKESNDGDETD